MARFTIAQFTDGSVVADGWFYPVAGRKYGLYRDNGKLMVCNGEGDTTYTWPRGRSMHEAGRLAIAHYQRRTAADPFDGSSYEPDYD